MPANCEECRAREFPGWTHATKCQPVCFFASDGGAAELRWLEYMVARRTDGISGNASFDMALIDHLYGGDCGGMEDRRDRIEQFHELCAYINAARAAMKGS